MTLDLDSSGRVTCVRAALWLTGLHSGAADRRCLTDSRHDHSHFTLCCITLAAAHRPLSTGTLPISTAEQSPRSVQFARLYILNQAREPSDARPLRTEELSFID